jgi:hypothetical protein
VQFVCAGVVAAEVVDDDRVRVSRAERAPELDPPGGAARCRAQLGACRGKHAELGVDLGGARPQQRRRGRGRGGEAEAVGLERFVDRARQRLTVVDRRAIGRSRRVVQPLHVQVKRARLVAAAVVDDDGVWTGGAQRALMVDQPRGDPGCGTQLRAGRAEHAHLGIDLRRTQPQQHTRRGRRRRKPKARRLQPFVDRARQLAVVDRRAIGRSRRVGQPLHMQVKAARLVAAAVVDDDRVRTCRAQRALIIDQPRGAPRCATQLPRAGRAEHAHLGIDLRRTQPQQRTRGRGRGGQAEAVGLEGLVDRARQRLAVVDRRAIGCSRRVIQPLHMQRKAAHLVAVAVVDDDRVWTGRAQRAVMVDQPGGAPGGGTQLRAGRAEHAHLGIDLGGAQPQQHTRRGHRRRKPKAHRLRGLVDKAGQRRRVADPRAIGRARRVAQPLQVQAIAAGSSPPRSPTLIEYGLAALSVH